MIAPGYTLVALLIAAIAGVTLGVTAYARARRALEALENQLHSPSATLPFNPQGHLHIGPLDAHRQPRQFLLIFGVPTVGRASSALTLGSLVGILFWVILPSPLTPVALAPAVFLPLLAMLPPRSFAVARAAEARVAGSRITHRDVEVPDIAAPLIARFTATIEGHGERARTAIVAELHDGSHATLASLNGTWPRIGAALAREFATALESPPL